MRPLIVGIGGTTRPGSSSERLTAAVLASAETLGARTLMFGGEKLSALPLFRPESTERTPQEQELLGAVRAADGLVIGTPGYHAGVSGLVKNAIDLLEDTRGDARVYFDGIPVGIVVSAAGPQALGATLGAMRVIVAAMRGWSTPIAITVNSVTEQLFDADSGALTAGIRGAVEGQASQVMDLAARHDRSRDRAA